MKSEGQRVYYPASLRKRERLITWAVGIGVGVGLPVLMVVIFAVILSQPPLLLFPLLFLIAFGIPHFFRPLGYGVNPVFWREDRGHFQNLAILGQSSASPSCFYSWMLMESIGRGYIRFIQPRCLMAAS